jgi:Mlc titration factor MtfA (ptsG expression regulator)
MGLQTKRFTTSAGIALATLVGLVVWVVACVVIVAGVTP